MALNKPELATILAALRYWQRNPDVMGADYRNLASHGASLEPLNTAQVEALAQRIETVLTAPPHAPVMSKCEGERGGVPCGEEWPDVQDDPEIEWDYKHWECPSCGEWNSWPDDDFTNATPMEKVEL